MAQGDLTTIMRGESAIPESPTSARFFDLTAEPIIKSIGDDYCLGPGDILTINLGNITADEVQQQISTQGDVMLPTVGKVKIEGMTVSEAQTALDEACGKVFRNHSVKIQLNQVRKIEVYLVGQVHQPGIYLCYSGTTISQFMQLTGRLIFNDPSIAGFGEVKFYNRTNPHFVQVLPEGSIRKVNLKRGDKVTVVDLTDIIVDGNKDADIALEHGDVIHIPMIGDSVVVKGGVNPGRYEILEGDTLKDIVEIAGGSGAMNMSEILTVENIDELSRSARTVDLNTGKYIDDSSQFKLASDMIIRIPQHQEYVYIIGAVPFPGQQAFIEGDTLMDYLGRAGGFVPGNQMADTMIIRRLGENQKRDIIHMDLKKVLKSDNVGDIEVYPGDIVFIPLKNQPFPPRDVINSLLGLGGLIESIFNPTKN
jgi:polysaccharide export outer membrane protein